MNKQCGGDMMKYLPWIILLVIVSVAGCAPVISKNLLQQVDTNVTFESVLENPESYKQKIVVWGGEIISTQNRQEGTVIEVLQKPLQYGHQPTSGDASGGRFLALYDGYLDSAVYSNGREVTVAGMVTGRRTQRLDEIDYVYPLITVKELHLWAELSKEAPVFHDHPRIHWRYHGPFCCPWW